MRLVGSLGNSRRRRNGRARSALGRGPAGKFARRCNPETPFATKGVNGARNRAQAQPSGATMSTLSPLMTILMSGVLVATLSITALVAAATTRAATGGPAETISPKAGS